MNKKIKIRALLSHLSPNRKEDLKILLVKTQMKPWLALEFIL